MKRKLMYSIIGLRKYFQLGSQSKEVKKSELLSSNEALKSFGRLWLEHPEDVMMMVEVMKTEFIAETKFNDGEMATFKKAMAQMINFLRECATEWTDFEREQAKRQEE